MALMHLKWGERHKSQSIYIKYKSIKKSAVKVQTVNLVWVYKYCTEFCL